MVAETEKIRVDIKELEAKIQDGERRLDALQSEARAQLSLFIVTSDPQEEIQLPRIAQMEASGRRLHPGGDPNEETRDIGRFFPRFGASRRWASQGGCFDVQFDRPSRRADEAVRVVGAEQSRATKFVSPSESCSSSQSSDREHKTRRQVQEVSHLLGWTLNG